MGNRILLEHSVYLNIKFLHQLRKLVLWITYDWKNKVSQRIIIGWYCEIILSLYLCSSYLITPRCIRGVSVSSQDFQVILILFHLTFKILLNIFIPFKRRQFLKEFNFVLQCISFFVCTHSEFTIKWK